MHDVDPVIDLNNSSDKCGEPPTPDEAMLILPGFALRRR